jgi:hypothetical protein
VALRAGGEGRAVRYALYARSFAGAGLDAARAGGEPDECRAPTLAADADDADATSAHAVGRGNEHAAAPASGRVAHAWRRVTRRRRGIEASPASHAPPVTGAATPAAAEAFAACRGALASALSLASPDDPLPPLRGSFLALENLAHTRQYLRLPRRATLAQIADAGAALCASGARRRHRDHRAGADDELAYRHDDAPDETHAADAASRHCFGAAYAVAEIRGIFKSPGDIAKGQKFDDIVRQGLPLKELVDYLKGEGRKFDFFVAVEAWRKSVAPKPEKVKPKIDQEKQMAKILELIGDPKLLRKATE